MLNLPRTIHSKSNKNPNDESLKKLLSLSRERAEYGDTKEFEFVERNKNLCADDLLNNKACYHKKSCSEFTNIENRNRATQRYTDALEQGQATIVKRKAGRPSSNKPFWNFQNGLFKAHLELHIE